MAHPISANEEFIANILGVVPERALEFKNIILSTEPNIFLVSDKKNFTFEMNAGLNLFQYDHKSSSAIWVFGFIAIKFSENCYPIALLEYLSGETTVELLPQLPDDLLYKDISTYRTLQSDYQALQEMLSIDTLEHFNNWPKEIPPPIGKPNDISGKAAFDLLCMAIAFSILHEFKHLLIYNENIAVNDYEEELSCDSFALHFILDNTKDYSVKSGECDSHVRMKRAMGIAIFCGAILAITPVSHWKGTSTHPPIYERIRRIVDELDFSPNNDFWMLMAKSLYFVLSQNTDPKTYQKRHSSLKSCCYYLIDQIEITAKLFS